LIACSPLSRIEPNPFGATKESSPRRFDIHNQEMNVELEDVYPGHEFACESPGF